MEDPNSKRLRFKRFLQLQYGDSDEQISDLNITLVLKYTTLEGKNILIYNKDVQTLNSPKFINDTIIEFYSEYLKSKSSHLQVYLFSSLFFEAILPRTNKFNVRDMKFAKVEKWTKTIELFEKKFIIFPTSWNKHWVLGIVCLADNDSLQDETSASSEVKKKKFVEIVSMEELVDGNGNLKKSVIIIFDSNRKLCRKYGFYYGRDIAKCINGYLHHEFNKRRKGEKYTHWKNLPYIDLVCPQQTNGYDCGIFLLQYMESFLSSPEVFFKMKNHKTWFVMNDKRKEIKDLISALAQEK